MAARLAWAAAAVAVAWAVRARARALRRAAPRPAAWPRAVSDAGLGRAELARFARQLAVPAFGARAQARLRGARVLVVGAGGLGSPVLGLLAAAGVGALGVVDGDRVEVSNLHRQLLHGEADVGDLKAESARRAIARMNAGVQVQVHACFLSARNAMQLIADYDMVVEATDSLASKYIVNDACRLSGKPLALAAAQGLEGQCAVYAPHGPCYRCMFPRPTPPAHRKTCQEDGVLGPVPYVVGSIQALQTIQYLAADEAARRADFGKYLHMFDGSAGHLGMRRVKLPQRRREACALCSSTSASIRSMKDSADFAARHELYATCYVPPASAQPGGKYRTISWALLQRMDPAQVLLVDVREPRHWEMLRFEGALQVSIEDLVQQESEQARVSAAVEEKLRAGGCRRVEVAVFCSRGNDSKVAAGLIAARLDSSVCSVSHISGGMASYYLQ